MVVYLSMQAKANTKCAHPEEAAVTSWSRQKQKKEACTISTVHSQQRLHAHHHRSPGTMERWPPWLTLLLISMLCKNDHFIQLSITFLSILLYYIHACALCFIFSHIGPNGMAQGGKSPVQYPFYALLFTFLLACIFPPHYKNSYSKVF